MSLLSSRKIQVFPSPRSQTVPSATRMSGAALEHLRSETVPPAFPREILIGLARLAEALLISSAGLACLLACARVPAGAPRYFAILLVIASSAVAIAKSPQVYSIAAFRRPALPLLRIAMVWLAVFFCIWGIGHEWAGQIAPPAAFLGAWYSLGLGFLIVERISLAWIVGGLARVGRLKRRAAVVGGGDFAVQLLRDLADCDSAELQLLGLFDDRGDERAPETVEGIPKLGNVDDLVALARYTRVDLIIFALPITAEARIQEMLRKLSVLPIDIRLAAHANRLKLRPRAYSYIGRAPMLDILDKPLGVWDIVVKTTLDRVIGACALLGLSPVLALAAIAVKLDSKGPILFQQTRYGFNNETIQVYKFRSMHADQLDPQANKLVGRDDPRVTRVGRFLRRSSIDELPQLFNVVFKGDLSLVGPRPHAVHAKAVDRQYDEVVESYFSRHRVKPGLTGWAQVRGWRGETDTAEKIQQRVNHDLYYIENWSLMFDLYILVVTPWALIRGQNAF